MFFWAKPIRRAMTIARTCAKELLYPTLEEAREVRPLAAGLTRKCWARTTTQARCPQRCSLK